MVISKTAPGPAGRRRIAIASHPLSDRSLIAAHPRRSTRAERHRHLTRRRPLRSGPECPPKLECPPNQPLSIRSPKMDPVACLGRCQPRAIFARTNHSCAAGSFGRPTKLGALPNGSEMPTTPSLAAPSNGETRRQASFASINRQPTWEARQDAGSCSVLPVHTSCSRRRRRRREIENSAVDGGGDENKVPCDGRARWPDGDPVHEKTEGNGPRTAGSSSSVFRFFALRLASRSQPCEVRVKYVLRTPYV